MFDKQWHRIIGRITVVGFLAGPSLASPLASASETKTQLEDVPTGLLVPPDPVKYPDPVCLGCKIVTKRPAGSSGADGSTAVLTLTYLDEAAPTFVGDIVLTVFLLDSDEYRLVTIDGILLTHGQTMEYEVSAELDWSWSEAERVLVELHCP